MYRPVEKKRTRKDLVLISLILAILLIIASLYYIDHVRISLYAETQNYLQEVSEQSAKVLNKQITGDLKYLQSLADSIGYQDDVSIASSIRRLEREAAQTSFKRLAILLPDGTSATTDGRGGNFTDQPYFVNSMRGKRCVLAPAEDPLSHGLVNTYTVPIYHNGQVEGVLMANISTTHFQNLIAVDSFERQTSSFVLSGRGEVLMSAAGNAGAVDLGDCALLLTPGSDYYGSEAGVQIRDDLANRQSGAVSLRSGNCRAFLSYAPIGINDWYLLTTTPASVATLRLNEILMQTALMSFGSIFLLIALFLYIFYSGEQKNQQLAVAAYCDPVTKGNNWNRFQLEANRYLDQSSDKYQAIVIFDVNKFKAINESYGHAMGDRILRRIDSAMQQTLVNGEPYGRYLGDRFVLVTEYSDISEVKELIDSLNEQIEKVLGGEISEKITCAYGIYQIHDYTMSLRKMVDRAIIAFQTVKNRHENTCAVFDDSMRAEIMHNKLIEDHMDEALEKHEFVIYLQPKVGLKDSEIESAEALIRWKSDEYGLIPPGYFIPLFEKNGFIVKLDHYVLEGVCAQLRRWLDMGISPHPIAVNISRVHLTRPDFVESICAVLQKYSIPNHLIELELTESAIFDNMDIMKDLLGQLHDLGFILSMDDFGSGYSSLHTLKDLPIDTLKIDRGFFIVSNADGCSRSRIVVRNVISMAKELNITTIAEGIEEKEQVDYLKDMGCDIIQGFYFGRPMPMEEFAERAYGVRFNPPPALPEHETKAP